MTLTGFSFEAAKEPPRGKRDDAPTLAPMRATNPAQRRNPTTDEKKVKRRQVSKTAGYSTPGYYLVDKDQGPHAGPFDSPSEAGLQQSPSADTAIQYLDQAPASAHVAEPFPAQLQQVNGSRSVSDFDSFLFMASDDKDDSDDDSDKPPWLKDKGTDDSAKDSDSKDDDSDDDSDDSDGDSGDDSDDDGDDSDDDDEDEGSSKPPWLKGSRRQSSPETEARLLAAMAKATPAEAQALMGQLEGLRHTAALARMADAETDLAMAVIHDHLTPVSVHEHHTAATDWISSVAEYDGDSEALRRAMLTEASLWYGRVSPEVKADRSEFGAQARGVARRIASAAGTERDAAERIFLDFVGHLQAHGQGERPGVMPWDVPPEVGAPVPLAGENFNPDAEQLHTAEAVLPLDNGAEGAMENQQSYTMPPEALPLVSDALPNPATERWARRVEAAPGSDLGTKTSRSSYGEQAACRTCNSDIEFHGGEHGWIDRGGNTHCDTSGQHPTDENGVSGTYPHRKHQPYREATLHQAAPGSDLGTNPAAEYDPEQAHAQSGEAQSGLPLAPGAQISDHFDFLTDFPDTGPAEVPSSRAPNVQMNGGRHQGAGPDPRLKATSPQGQADATAGFEGDYSSQRHIDYSGTGASVLGTVPVQGYGTNPSGEMWDWDLQAPGSGAAAVADVPPPGVEGGPWPQPGPVQDPEGKEAKLALFRQRVAGGRR